MAQSDPYKNDALMQAFVRGLQCDHPGAAEAPYLLAR